MFYEIPADRTGMSAAALRGVALAARKSYRDALRSAEPPSNEDAAAYRAQFEAIDVEAVNEAEIEAGEAQEAADAAAAAAAEASNEEPDPEPDPEPEPEVVPATEASAPAPTPSRATRSTRGASSA
jgi:hypothetical protein